MTLNKIFHNKRHREWNESVNRLFELFHLHELFKWLTKRIKQFSDDSLKWIRCKRCSFDTSWQTTATLLKTSKVSIMFIFVKLLLNTEYPQNTEVRDNKMWHPYPTISQLVAKTHLLCNHTRSIDRRSASNCEELRQKRSHFRTVINAARSAFPACHNFLMLHNDGHKPTIVITPVCGIRAAGER